MRAEIKMDLSERELTLLLHGIDMAIGDFQKQLSELKEGPAQHILGSQRVSKDNVMRLCKVQIEEYMNLRERVCLAVNLMK